MLNNNKLNNNKLNFMGTWLKKLPVYGVTNGSMSKKHVMKLHNKPKTQEILSNLISFELLVKNTKTLPLHCNFELDKRSNDERSNN